MTKRYDLVIVGTGTAAMVAAMRVRARLERGGHRFSTLRRHLCAAGLRSVGPHVDEVINVFALAIRNGLTAEHLKTTIFAYPTGASDIGYML
jgi:pyruvate/2-oxoglutarate dehydrogenase complex dihydrolipoamide dehydrogenase (E3) component